MHACMHSLALLLLAAATLHAARLTVSVHNITCIADQSRLDYGSRHLAVSLLPGVYRDVSALEHVVHALPSHVHVTIRSADATSPAVVDGGVPITTWEKKYREGVQRWAARAPDVLHGGGAWPTAAWRPVRELYVNGLRWNRTWTNVTSICLDRPRDCGNAANNTYYTTSAAPLAWSDPTAVEFVSDHTWMQHRCPVTAIVNLTSLSQYKDCRANWTEKIPGASPGTAIATYVNETWESCQQRCCLSVALCKAIIYHTKITECILLDRTYEQNYLPAEGSFVANMNAPPSPSAVTLINVSYSCWNRAFESGSYSLSFPSAIVNTGEFHPDSNEWFFDRSQGLFWITFSDPDADPNQMEIVAGFNETLLRLNGASNVAIENIIFRHTTFLQANKPEGFVERYGNVYYDSHGEYAVPPAALMIANSSSVRVENCTFELLGMWGLRLYNASQGVRVNGNRFKELGGGSICVGNVNDTGEINPILQMAGIELSNNTIEGMGREYKGAPGLHTFCMRDSLISHNLIRDIGYTGISFNWPSPQGPTLGPDADSSRVGYSRNNRVEHNDVSEFMSYMRDGGGIHTIGRSYNTTISYNYFHDAAAGQPGEHSSAAQSIIYIDNYSCYLNITSNVVDNCPHTEQGYYYFQVPTYGLAHGNFVDHLFVRNSGHLSNNSEPCNCSDVELFDNADFPAYVDEIIRQAGPL